MNQQKDLRGRPEMRPLFLSTKETIVDNFHLTETTKNRQIAYFCYPLEKTTIYG